MKKVIYVLSFLIGLFSQTIMVHALDNLSLTIGSAQVIRMHAVEKVVIGNPQIADIKLINDEELLVTGKKVGTTSIIFWKKNGQQEIVELMVSNSRSAKAMIQVDVQVMEMSKTDGKDLGLNWEELIGNPSQLTLTESQGHKAQHPRPDPLRPAQRRQFQLWRQKLAV